MTLAVQFSTLVAMFSTGIAMAWVFDIYTWFRHRLRFRKGMTFLFDILYWIVFAVAVLLILYEVNQGRIRIPIYFMILAGGLFYFQVFSRPFLRIWESIVALIVRLAKLLWRIVMVLFLRPITWIISTLFSIIVWISTLLWKIVKTIFSWISKPLIAIYKGMRQFSLALIRNIGKMIVQLWRRNPKDE